MVHKSVEIVDFSDPIDPTFLDSIEEVKDRDLYSEFRVQIILILLH